MKDLAADSAQQMHDEIGRFKIPTIILSPDKLMFKNYKVNKLKWDCVRYKKSEISKVPNNSRGVYAFVLCHNNNILPPHGYVLYIGIAGYNSNRSLRDRYEDYFQDSKLRKRPKIMLMIGTWKDILHFYYAPVDNKVSSNDLVKLEKQLISAILPPFSVGDMDAILRSKVGALR